MKIKTFKNFNESKIESDKSFNIDGLIEMLISTITLEGFMTKYVEDIKNDVSQLLKSYKEEDLKVIWYAKVASDEGAKTPPEDFDVDTYTSVMKSILGKILDIGSVYLDREMDEF